MNNHKHKTRKFASNFSIFLYESKVYSLRLECFNSYGKQNWLITSHDNQLLLAELDKHPNATGIPESFP